MKNDLLSGLIHRLEHNLSQTRSLSILIVFLSTFLTAFSTINTGTDAFLNNISYGTNTTYIEIPFLIVNTHPSQRTIINKNEHAGQKDIQDLLKYVTHEEKWIYLPDRELWIEMGIHAKKIKETERLGFQVFSSMEEIEKIILTEKKMIDYHFHPETCHFTESKSRVFLKEANMDDTENNLSLIKANYFLPVQHIYSALPGRDDLLQLLVSSSLFYRVHPDGDFCHKIVSTYGITAYSVNDDKKAVIRNFPLKDSEAIADKLSLYIDHYIGSKLTLKHNDLSDKGTGIKIIRQTVRRLNYLDLVQLEFTPHEEYQ